MPNSVRRVFSTKVLLFLDNLAEGLKNLQVAPVRSFLDTGSRQEVAGEQRALQECSEFVAT